MLLLKLISKMYIACIIHDDLTLEFTEEKTVKRAGELTDLHLHLKKLEEIQMEMAKFKLWVIKRIQETQNALEEVRKGDPANQFGKDRQNDKLQKLMGMKIALMEVQDKID